MAKIVGAAKFKSECLALMDEVRASGTEVVITKQGHPVAKLVPVQEKRADSNHPLDFLFIGGGEILGDIISPVVPWEDYEALK